MKYLFVIALIMTGTLLPAQTIPSDAAPNCPVSSTTFDQWFQSGKPAVDGVVNPANSVGFAKGSTCNFYAWAKQMFLWVTSESGGGRVFDSAAFYDVSPPDSGKRTFLRHDNSNGSFIHSMMLRAAKGGPHDLPIIEDKSGQLFEVMEPPIDHSGKQIVVNSAGNLVEVSKASITSNHRLAFQDKTGNKIELPSAGIRRSESLPTDTIQTAEEFMVNGEPVFIDSSGNIINVEQGQAGGSGVLETQQDGLVYYLTMTNDVYAYFLTKVKNEAIANAEFPTTQAELNDIKKYAAANGKPGFTDEQALTVELKSSWIEVTDATKSNYITTTAMIPVYDTSNPQKWVQTSQRKATLGLVGLHIVGSVKDHPEMIWATFERFGNTPNGAYTYTKADGTTGTVLQSTDGNWLFSKTGSTAPFNIAHMTAKEASIIAAAKQTISPSDSLRVYAWGAGPNNAESNSYLISIHNSVNTLMPKGDIRSNYFLVGATWTTNGTAPPVGITGSTNVANSTMETYTQSTKSTDNVRGCFLCHTGSLAPGTISHIFGGDTNGLQPLFPASSGNSR
ncbi:hypothetical protein [Granulicella mallensis]|uniref:Uncharacterized protein n=1 Tax=Granulicella mallensis (strain ATCC BAA-1857 / DSM 23137 / MP5ACTX8) TaxID=682795 RepID=G8NYJ8_GRAMM|nr:hypothetical protein [Granulicella mallensis]AEU39057.1 hypothetical protein AciX8_4788 [Granulicella mallensis MP5ACTX8]